MKLELNVGHLAPYLPHGLELQYMIRDVPVRTGVMTRISHNESDTHPTRVSIDYCDSEHIWMFKPVLRPLSQLTHDEMEAIIKSAWGWDEVVSFHGVNSVSVCVKGADYDPTQHDPEDLENYDVRYIEQQEESCGADAIVTVPIPFRLSDVISYGWQDEFMYSVDIKLHDRFIQELYKRHYDLQGLLKAGLAIEKTN